MKSITALFAIFCLICSSAFAQNVAVSKSEEIVVIKGKEYYLHTVEKGQTLYSICKAYEVPVEEVRKVNDKTDNALALQDIIKIPHVAPSYVQPTVEQVVRNVASESTDVPADMAIGRRDKELYQHIVKPGETLYSISRLYNIKVKRILRYNRHLNEKMTLNVGDVVYLPKDDIYIPQQNIRVEQQDVTIEKTPVEEVVVDKKEEVAEPQVDTIPESIGVATPKTGPIKIAMLLPFFAKEQVWIDSTATLKTPGILKKSEQFIQFYQGTLLAIDSLKRAGYDLDVHVFDTEKASMKMQPLLFELNALNPDVVVGPVYGSVYSVIVHGLENKQTPVIYPLSARGDEFKHLQSFVQVNPSATVIERGLINWIGKKSNAANVIGVRSEQVDGRLLYLGKEQVMKNNQPFSEMNLSGLNQANIAGKLSEGTENVLFFPSTNEAEVGRLMALLSVVADKYPITLVGLPEWHDFASIEGDLFYKLNVSYVVAHYVNNHSYKTKQIEKEYLNYYHTLPTQLAYRAYDMMLYLVPIINNSRANVLDGLKRNVGVGVSSSFGFSAIEGGMGMENKSLFVVSYTPQFEIKVERVGDYGK
ncbi:MAG: LysM peptidoglycan-binding domain-containing protein [Marinifilaceae bacterium]